MSRVELEAAVAEGLSISQLAERFGYASGGPVRHWLKKYELKTIRSLNPELNRKRSLRFTDEQITEAVVVSVSLSGVCRSLGCNISSRKHVASRITYLNLDTSHFTGRPLNYRSARRSKPNEVLVLLPEDALRTDAKKLRRVMEEVGVEYKCVGCGNTGEWLGEVLSLEIDHIDGNWRNNLIENLRFLCPNCHGITPTHRNKKREPSKH